jgi:hypothetical protein
MRTLLRTTRDATSCLTGLLASGTDDVARTSGATLGA